MSKIIADKDFVLDAFNPHAIAKDIAFRLRERRLELNLTRQKLAEIAGVSQGTLKRFENMYEISLKHLLQLAVVLDSTEEFIKLFTKRHYESIDAVLKASSVKKRQRGKRNV